MKRITRCLSLLLTACLLLCVVPARAAEIVDSGTCDKDFKNVTWALDADGGLVISGTGEMEYFPWRSRYFTTIKAVIITNGVTGICDSAFYECNKMQILSIPNTVTRIERAAFYDCKSLTDVSVPDSVTSLGDSAFAHCWALEKITLPNGLTSIPTNLFYECMKLPGVTIPTGVKSVGKRAFCKCYGLKSVKLPKSVTSIEEYAFDACVGLTDVYYEGSEANWKAIAIKDGNTALTSAKIHYNQKIGPSAHTHKWNAGVVTYAPGCGTPGVKTYACSVCGTTKTETLPKTNAHKWDAGKVYMEPTCAAEGVMIYTCSVCKGEKREPIAKKKEHNWNQGVTTRPATCGVDGVKTYTCIACHTTKTETIPKTNAHKWDAGKVTKAPTAAADGVKTYTCSVCKATKTETIPKTGSAAINTARAKESGGFVYTVPGMTAKDLTALAGSGAAVSKADGKALAAKEAVASGMTLKKPDGAKRTIVIRGDIDGNGKIESADARLALRRSVSLEKFADWQTAAALVSGSDKVTSADARLILRASVGLEKLPLA